MSVINIEEAVARNPESVVLNIISQASKWGCEVRQLPDKRVYVITGVPNITVEGVGKKFFVENTKIVAYKLADTVYEVDVQRGDERYHVVIIDPIRTTVAHNGAESIREDLKRGKLSFPRKSLAVISEYEFSDEDIPVEIYVLEGEDEKIKGFARYSKTSGVVGIDLWEVDDEGASRLSIVAF